MNTISRKKILAAATFVIGAANKNFFVFGSEVPVANTSSSESILSSTLLTTASSSSVLATVEEAAAPLILECEIGSDGSCLLSPSKISVPQEDDGGKKSFPPSTSCHDLSADCEAMAKEGKCTSEFQTLRHQCPKACLLCDNWDIGYVRNIYSEGKGQRIDGELQAAYASRVDTYMYETVYSNDLLLPMGGPSTTILITTFKPVRDVCKNRHEECISWASAGECAANPGYMKLDCAPACFSCEAWLFKRHSCSQFDKDSNVWQQAGDLHRTFTRIMSNPAFAPYKPRPLSQPKTVPSTKTTNPADQRQEQEQPWLVLLEDFLTPEECDILIEHGRQQGYRQSNSLQPDVENNVFKSDQTKGSEAWCVDECFKHPLTQRIHRRIEELIQIPQENYEHLHMLQYGVGNFDTIYTGYLPHHLEQAQGVRILSIFFHLNDVEEGGETGFPNLDIIVTPKKGQVLIWPAVLDLDPNMMDGRLDHEALPVARGVKYCATLWIHQRNFKKPFDDGCLS